jgi:hypothetical protein
LQGYVEPRNAGLLEDGDVPGLAEAPADIYMVLVDFVSILTRGFDEMIVEAASVFRDGYAVLNGPLANLSFPSVQAVTHKFADAAGGIYPTYWPFWFIDHWLDDLGRMIGRMGFAPVNVDPSRRPGKTHELRDLPLWTRIYDLTAPERHQQACNIMAQPDFEASDWMKEALAQYWPQIDLRSRAINALVLAGEDHIAAARGGVEPDERYLRIKANGEALLAQLQEQR